MVLGLFCLLRKQEVVAQRYFQHFECALDLGHTITYGSGRPDVTLELLVNDRGKDPELTFDSIERVTQASSSRFERPKQQAPLIARSGFREQCSKEKFDGADRDIHLGGDFFRAESLRNQAHDLDLARGEWRASLRLFFVVLRSVDGVDAIPPAASAPAAGTERLGADKLYGGNTHAGALVKVA
jgi:hypothetical protein